MPTNEQRLRHRMIERAVFRPSVTPAETSVLLWESLAAELMLIIGERGFASLYARSLHQTCAQFPWLALSAPRAPREVFSALASSLNARDPQEALAASAALLSIFTDTLILLIGELLTNNLLRKAWGDAVVNDAGAEHRP
jgi:hypothetical protein